MSNSKPTDNKFRNKFIEKASLLFRMKPGVVVKFALTGLFLGLAVWFFNQEKAELHSVGKALIGSDPVWITAGLCLVIIYIILQGLMYVASFATINARLNLWDAVILFLKRNFISVFIPAGGISSLAFFSNTIERKEISRSQVYFASTVYAFVGILSVVIVAVPAFLFAVTGNNTGTGKWVALSGSFVILLLIYLIYRSVIRKRSVYMLLVKVYPGSEKLIDEISKNPIVIRQLIYAILISICIDLVGITHVYVSMEALNLSPSLSTSIIAYIIVVLFLIISPFLRGLGTIEVSMSYILIHSGYSTVESVAITLLFRFFEFWLPLVAGIISFLVKIEKLLRRIIPSLLIFGLGIVNIVSVLSPGTPEKLQLLRDYLFFDIVNFSNGFVLITGLLLLVTAAFLLRGLRTVWWFAISLSLFSAVGHITKGINYPEAGIALCVFLVLISSRKEYYIKSNPRARSVSILASLASITAVLIYGVFGFYFLDKKHFQIDFNIFQSIKYTLQNFFLTGGDLVPRDSFSLDFLYTIRISGFASLAFLVYSLIRPYVFSSHALPEERAKAEQLIRLYGKSALDYFKIYFDKQIFFSSGNDSFISYKTGKNFAVVLEDPIARGREEMKEIILEFREFCYNNGLKEIYYRVPKENIDIYSELSKKSLFLGQEGVVDLSKFTLEGHEKKSIRNALNKITEQGYLTHINTPPLKDGLIQKLNAVSDEWLKITGRKEIIFSQGMFSAYEIKNQTVLTVENREEKIIAFLNIIPDYANNEGTYDLLRKTADAPNGIMDYILVELFKYFKSKEVRFVNLGLAPMSGLDDPQKFSEKSIKFAYEKIRAFSHYKGQREYKQKFDPVWHDKFLIYDNDFDLIYIPAVLAAIIKPQT